MFKNNQYWGIAAVTLDLPVILADAKLQSATNTLNLALRDQTGLTLYGDVATFKADPALYPIKILGNTWELAGSPVSGWDNSIKEPLFVFRVTGLIIVGLAATLAYLSTNRHARLQLAVESRTTEISEINHALAKELTERVKAEQALEETQARNFALIKAIPDLMIRIDGNGNYLEVISNSTIESFVPPAQMVGKNALDILPEPAARQRLDHIKQAILTRTPQIYEYGLELRGRPHWYETRLVAYTDNEVLIIIRDITTRRQMEAELQKNRLRLAEAQRIANLGHWEWDIINDESFWSEEVFRLYGLSPGQLKPNYRIFLSLVHPDDRAAVETAVTAALSNRTPYNIDHRVILPDGAVRVLNQQAEVTVDPQRQPVRMLGTMQDITERKTAEQERERLLAAEREQRLLAEILHEVTLALNSQPSHKAVLNEILRQVGRLTPHSAANIMLLEDNTLRVACWQGYEAFGPVTFLANMVQSIDNFPLETTIIREKTPLVIPDTQQESRWVTVQDTVWIKSHLSMPICRQNRVLGMLRLDSDTANTFSPADTRRLQPLVNVAAIALENTRLYEQALKDANTRSVLLQEVNHRVKNNLSAIIGILYAGKRHATGENKTAYAAIMSGLINRIQGLAAVHSLLSHSEWAPLNLAQLIGQIIRSVLQALPHGQEFRVKITPSSIKVTSQQAYYLAQVINELTTNSVRHGVAGKIGQISVTIAM